MYYFCILHSYSFGGKKTPLLQKERELILIIQNFSFEIEDAGLNPMQEAFTVEAIHAAAYSNNTVGLPKICPGKTINIS